MWTIANTRTTHSKASFISGLTLAIFICAAPAQGEVPKCAISDLGAAENYVLKLKTKADEILSENPNPLVPLKSHLSTSLEYDRLARFALGRYWNSASTDQRHQYLRLFQATVSHMLATTVLQFKGAKIGIDKKIKLGARNILIKSHVITPDGGVQKFGWRIRLSKCRAMAIDLVKDGVSMLTTKREEFTAVVSRNGMDGLLESLRALEQRQLSKLNEASLDDHSIQEILNRMLLEAAKKYRKQGREQGHIHRFIQSSLQSGLMGRMTPPPKYFPVEL